jgi:hypothetical protein
MTFKTSIWHPNGFKFLLNLYSCSYCCFSVRQWDSMYINPSSSWWRQIQWKGNCAILFSNCGFTNTCDFVLQETAVERWRPILGVESIILSVISMLSDPNDESPANIDAAVSWAKHRTPPPLFHIYLGYVEKWQSCIQEEGEKYRQTVSGRHVNKCNEHQADRNSGQQ